MPRFQGKTVIVTGAGNGIGAATAARFAAEGARLLLVDLDPSVALVAEDLGAEAMVLDLSSDEAPAEVAARAGALFGTLDVLVNNAGIGGARPLAEADDAFLDRMIGVNLRAVYRLTRECLALLRRPGGNIVMISSTLGLAGHPNVSAYAMTKGGVAQLTRQLAAELGPEGLRVNAVAPGVIETQMTRDRVRDNDFYQRAFLHVAPLRGHGQPEDIAAAVAFLAADEARFVSAQVLSVDGGWTEARHPPLSLG